LAGVLAVLLHLVESLVHGVELLRHLPGVRRLAAVGAFLGVRLGVLVRAGVGGRAGRLALALGLWTGPGVAALPRVLPFTPLPAPRLGLAGLLALLAGVARTALGLGGLAGALRLPLRLGLGRLRLAGRALARPLVLAVLRLLVGALRARLARRLGAAFAG